MTIKVRTDDTKAKTYVFLVLDRSSSMEPIRDDTIANFNEQLATLKNNQTDNLETVVSLTTFGSDVTSVFHKKAIASVEPITRDSYKPDGMTAMYDAVGAAIDSGTFLLDGNDPNTSFLVVILSDGQENSSRKYSAADIASKITELQNTKRWTFTYIGANQDLSAVSKSLNIPLGNTQVFTASSFGVRNLQKSQNAGLRRYMTARSLGGTQTDSFYDSSADASSGAVDPATSDVK